VNYSIPFIEKMKLKMDKPENFIPIAILIISIRILIDLTRKFSG